ncbi:unnamed protein product [Microthlaspi erraticum]|uniref:Uncharacterized protein n=1 Tax=Microthlaspi erraticum TaxID=1685480 RepID=A0A6D2JNQ4_9BRAS|nr:unnamed protein product [Microthlaspi erraticum]
MSPPTLSAFLVDASVVGCDLVGEEMVKEGIKFPVSDLSPLDPLAILVRERMGLIPMSRNLSSPSLIVPVPSLQRRCWQVPCAHTSTLGS